MNKLDEGARPAFPVTTHDCLYDLGMTVRDWFAGQALAGVIEACKEDTRAPGEPIEAMFARKAFAVADAMLKERAGE